MSTDDTREDTEESTDDAVEGTQEGSVDGGLVDLLSWVLDTETRARIYLHLRQNPGSTSEEIADGTGLYPSTVREALAELAEEGIVTRGKRESGGAGNNPYEYVAITPGELVSGIVGDLQEELNTVFNLDDALANGEAGEGPVRITVNDPERNGRGTAGDD
jgi:predicted transcriptional regulator